MRSKLLGAIGLMRRSGTLTMGFDPVVSEAEKGKVRLIVLASDLSPKSAKGMERVAERHNVKIVTVPVVMDEFWHLLGKRTGILGASNQGLADIVLRELEFEKHSQSSVIEED